MGDSSGVPISAERFDFPFGSRRPRAKEPLSALLCPFLPFSQVHDLHRCTFGPGSAMDGPRATPEAAAAWGRFQRGQDAFINLLSEVCIAWACSMGM